MRIRSRASIKKKAPALMVTPLLDMFTIILIFLIVSFEAENYEFRTAEDLELPESSAQTKLKPGVNVQLTRSGVYVGDTLVHKLAKGEFSKKEREDGRSDNLVDALKEAKEMRFGEGAQSNTEEAESDAEYDGNEPIIVLQADKGTSYQDLYVVLRSAASAGFFKYRLAAMKG